MPESHDSLLVVQMRRKIFERMILGPSCGAVWGPGWLNTHMPPYSHLWCNPASKQDVDLRMCPSGGGEGRLFSYTTETTCCA